MTSRSVETEEDRELLLIFLGVHKLPMTVEITPGKHRSVKSNRLQRQWMNDIAAQLGESAEYWRGWCKLNIGVGILKAASETFAADYDREVKPLPYEFKLKLMMEPFSFPVTSKMTSKQMTDYLDTIQRDFTARGVELTNPEGLKWGRK